MSISKKLKQLRDNRNWSQRFVANLMNVDRSTISKYETGQIIPTYQALVRFAEIYKIDKAFLLEELDQPHINKQLSATPYILKEESIDHDLDLIMQLLQNYSDLKKSLLELYSFDEKSKALAIRLFQSQITAIKQR